MANRAAGIRCLSQSLFPLGANRGYPHRRWHDHYPTNVPPGLSFEPLRAERLLLCAGRHCPQRVALRYFRTHWTYEELIARVKRVAANWRALGVRPGDVVMMVLPNCPEFVVTWFALHWLGAQVLPANPLLSANDLLMLARKAKAVAVVALDVALGPVLEMTHRYALPVLVTASLSGHLPWHLRCLYRVQSGLTWKPAASRHTRVYPFGELAKSNGRLSMTQPVLSDPRLPAVLQPTGGTTGTPKIAVLTHANLHANVAQLHVWTGLQPAHEVVLAVLPFFHVFGATVAMLSPIAGGSTILPMARFKPSRVWNVVQQFKPTVAPMVPFMYRALCHEMQRRGRNLTGLKYCMSGASAMPLELWQEFRRRTGAQVFGGYGLSEASPVTHVNPPDETARPATIGLPLPDTDARIVDRETGTVPLPPGEVGELIIRGPQVMAGYLDNSLETARVLRDGWLYTGDLAHMNEDGFFTIVDRKKDIIITGGLNVYPTEIEEVLTEHPSVRECAVIGEPDTLYGEKVVAYVVPVPGMQIHPTALKMHCRAVLARYKVPKEFVSCTELPKTFLGKVRRVALGRPAA